MSYKSGYSLTDRIIAVFLVSVCICMTGIVIVGSILK